MNNKNFLKVANVLSLIYSCFFALASVSLLVVGILSYVTSTSLDKLAWPAIILGGLATTASYFIIKYFWNSLK